MKAAKKDPHQKIDFKWKKSYTFVLIFNVVLLTFFYLFMLKYRS